MGSLENNQDQDKMQLSAILSTFTKLPFVIKIFVLSIFEWPLMSGSVYSPSSG